MKNSEKLSVDELLTKGRKILSGETPKKAVSKASPDFHYQEWPGQKKRKLSTWTNISKTPLSVKLPRRKKRRQDSRS